ncbi:hypothetical protein ACHAP5_011833 [Fusarium lateritium]
MSSSNSSNEDSSNGNTSNGNTSNGNTSNGNTHSTADNPSAPVSGPERPPHGPASQAAEDLEEAEAWAELEILTLELQQEQAQAGVSWSYEEIRDRIQVKVDNGFPGLKGFGIGYMTVGGEHKHSEIYPADS